MAGKGYEDGGEDQLDELESRIEDLEAKVTRLSNIKQPTMPPYPSIENPNPGDVPDDPLEGQYAVSNDDSGAWYYVNSKWRRASGNRMPNIHLTHLPTPFTFSGSAAPDTQRLQFEYGLYSPINHGGVIDTTIFDVGQGESPFFSSPVDHVNILKPGIYWAEARCGWYTDWGACRINLQYNTTNSEMYPVSDTWGYKESTPTEHGGVFEPTPHEASLSLVQTAVARRGFLFVSPYAFVGGSVVEVWTTLTNSSGSDKIANGTTRFANPTLVLIQMSDHSESNP